MRVLRFLGLLSLLLPAALRAQSSAPAPGTTVLLRPGDVVRLTIWREKDLSGDFPVDEAGVVVFPKLGPITVTGIAPAALRAQLVEWYQRYLRNPSIEVIPLRRITILGAVKQSGVYPVDPTITVADALALAGGVLPEGRNDRVELRRGGERVTASLRVNTVLADSQVQSGDQLFVPDRSWVSRNSTVVATLVSVGSSVLVALILR